MEKRRLSSPLCQTLSVPNRPIMSLQLPFTPTPQRAPAIPRSLELHHLDTPMTHSPALFLRIPDQSSQQSDQGATDPVRQLQFDIYSTNDQLQSISSSSSCHSLSYHSEISSGTSTVTMEFGSTSRGASSPSSLATISRSLVESSSEDVWEMLGLPLWEPPRHEYAQILSRQLALKPVPRAIVQEVRPGPTPSRERISQMTPPEALWPPYPPPLPPITALHFL